MVDVIILIAAIFAGAAWGWVIKSVWTDHQKFAPRVTISAERLTNLLLAAILGVLTGWFIVSITGCSIDKDDGTLEPPELRCNNITLESCLARVSKIDGGSED